MILQGLVALSCAEKERDAPDTRKGDQGINDSCQQRTYAAASPRYQVKLKDTHATPVQRTDDGEDQCNSVHDHGSCIPFC